MNNKLLADILQLSAAERIRLAQDIWDSVSELPDAAALTDEQKYELDQRLAFLEKNSLCRAILEGCDQKEIRASK